ncbi:uncharacterized protein TRAVEDRAFT_127349 [Trametes versicolor FP-101664 SS1]|uniref:uncharacterized protein n=1 Tax=Trametes versicolor (strain FP-101664) TaxID=717944 RepID=UPI0004621739|nr:uncharacterized protein TRAVEDRAFT_127349 [Trametes versicolor FP-101664 SS1]EIW56466.1 hypothetical protein TRAVEDRAFT_127349 [Trametes versicolor FP-101664 SS1]
MARRPLIAVDTHGPSRPSQSYGTISGESPSTLRASPERYRRDSWLDRVPEETTVDGEEEIADQERDEWDLAEYGYYSGSYPRKVAVYGLVPLTCIVTFLLLANLVRWIWPPRYPASPTLPRSFPSPLPEILLSAAFYSFTHALRVPLYNAATALFPSGWNTVAFNTTYVLLSQVLRLAALALLRVRHEMLYPLPTWNDPAFTTAWWLALGWAVADAATSVTQGYRQLALYSNVMVPEERVREILAVSRAAVMTERSASGGSAHGSREYMPLSPRNEREATGTEGTATPKANGSQRRREPVSVEEAVRMAVDQDVEQLMHLQEREELEEVYGVPVIYIPVFVPCLQRIDSFLFSLGFTLVLAWAYLRSPLSFPIGTDPLPTIYSNHALGIAFPVVVLAHLFLSLLHSPPVLPRIGVHTTAYVGLLVGLGGFFTGLGLWGALS